MIILMRTMLLLAFVAWGWHAPIMGADRDDNQEAVDFETLDSPAIEDEEKSEAVPVVEGEEKQEATQEEKSEAVPVVEDEEKQETMPEQVQKQQEQAQVQEDLEIAGIDTVDLSEPQGNWLFKRIWWERAEGKYEKARALVGAIMDLRMAFFDQRADLDKNVLDPFYLSIGLGQGELQVILQELIKSVEKERDQQGMLDEKESEFFDILKEQEKLLQQVALDVTSINDLDHAVDQALSSLMEQINITRGYEHESWQYFKEISRVLSDKRARELFYKMDTILKNISDVNNYIKTEFSDHFSQHIDTVRQQIERVKLAVQELKNKGIDLKAQFEQIILQKEAEKLEEAQEVDQDIDQELEQDEQQDAESGFISSYILQPLGSFGSLVANSLKAVWDGLVYVVWLPIEKIMSIVDRQSGDESIDDDVDVDVSVETDTDSEASLVADMANDNAVAFGASEVETSADTEPAVVESTASVNSAQEVSASDVPENKEEKEGN